MHPGRTEPPESNALPNGEVRGATTVVRETMTRTLLPDLQAIRGRGAVDRSLLTEKIRSVCRDAHTQGLHAEQVIILIKEMWAQLRPPLGYEGIQEQNQRLGDIVRLAIDEYYAPPDRPT